MYNKRITSVILAVVFTLVLFSCPDPFHITDEATLIINLGGGGRAVTWQHDEDPSILDELIYTITLTGPGDITINHTLTEGKTSITEKVAPGIWLVEVKALYEGVLYAEGEDYVDVIAGQKNSVTIVLHQPGNYDTFITSVNIHIAVPVKNDTPDTSATTHDTGYTVGTVSWTPEVADKFLGGIEYTAAVTLTADEGYTFAGLADENVKINNTHTATAVTHNEDGTVTVSYKFDATETRDVIGLDILNQPTALSYTHGDKLDLDGLKVKISYDSGDPVVVDFGVDERLHGLDTLPEDEDTLSHTLHNGKPVNVFYGQHISVNTNNLTVAKKTITIKDVTAVNREYIANNNLVDLEGGELVGVVPGDTVGFTLGSGTMANDSNGKNKTVTTAIQLTGADAGNYTLTQPDYVTVNIMAVIDISVGVWPTGIKGVFDECIQNDDVLFKGTREANASGTLTLAIPEGKTAEWQATVTGASANSLTPVIDLTGTGTFEVTTGGSITAAGTRGIAIRNSSTGLIRISGGEVASANTNTSDDGTILLSDQGTGGIRLEMTGGTVRNTSNISGARAIYNGGTGAVNISGGTVGAMTAGGEETSSVAIYNASTGVVTISGTATVTSANIAPSSGTIFLADSGTATAARLSITGGTVRNTSTNGNARAIYNNGTGAVNISGGTVGAMTAGGEGTLGVAIYNNSTGVVTISGTATITSANVSSTISTGSGTIFIGSEENTATRLIINGGTIINTANQVNGLGRAIYNNGSGAVEIKGGNISAGNGYVVFNYSTGKVDISGGEVSATTRYAVYNQSTGEVNISGGTVSATTGYAVYNYSTGEVKISGGTVIATEGTAAISSSIEVVNISGGTVTPTWAYITGFSISSGETYINNTNRTINVYVPYGTDVSGLTPTVTLQGGISYSPTESQDFSSSVPYTVTAVGGGTVSYEVKVVVQPALVSTTIDISAYTGLEAINAALIANPDIYNQDFTFIGTKTISGTMTDDSVILTLNIPAEITVNWEADLTGASVQSSPGIPGIPLIDLTGEGTFDVVTGGKIQARGAYGIAIRNSFTGLIKVSGGTVTSGNTSSTERLGGTINIPSGTDGTTPRLIVSGGTVSNTVTNTSSRTVNNYSTGGIEITGGTVSAMTGYAINNYSTGEVNISGGTVSTTGGRAINNNAGGEVNISGGTVSATTGYAIYSSDTGLITISQPEGATTTVTSANVSATQGTISISAATNTAERLKITGGTVRNTATNGNARAIYNSSTAAINISGGTVGAMDEYGEGTLGVAIYNNSTGVVTISQEDDDVPTLITSANTATAGGTIYQGSTGTTIIEGGKVKNTGNDANSRIIHIANSAATVTITGGTFETNASVTEPVHVRKATGTATATLNIGENAPNVRLPGDSEVFVADKGFTYTASNDTTTLTNNDAAWVQGAAYP